MLKNGATSLSVIFDIPTVQMYDSDDPIDSIKDYERTVVYPDGEDIWLVQVQYWKLSRIVLMD